MFWHQIAQALRDQREDVLLAVIISELQFLEVIGELLRGNSVVLDGPLLGVAQESLQAVDVDPAAEGIPPPSPPPAIT